ncbi:MAG TPA: NAD(P)H-binding protein [Conexibacter sp.]|nr:NAD(P)H-binding protein [Conexibacter sp.]
MRVAVIGGTGELGALVVAELAARGDDVRAVSRTAPAAGKLPAGVAHLRADLASGDGLRAALAGVEVVVDASNDRRRAREVLAEGTRRLGVAAADAGVRHHVAISIVGCDRVPHPYYKAKVAQEQALAEAPVPWSLLRATQFHALQAGAFAAAARARVLPKVRILLQPLDTAVVARRVAELVHAEPAGRVADMAGPQVERLDALAEQWRAHHGRRLLPLRIPPFALGGGGREMAAGLLTDPAAAVEGPTFAQWLARR